MKTPVKLLILKLTLASNSATAALLFDGPVKVTRILDGDTIEVISGDDYSGLYKNFRIRLNAIDAPEKSQPFGQRSRQFLADTIGGENVIINSHGNDRYGRILGDVMVRQCKPACVIFNVNEAMVKAGMAWAYRYHGVPTSHDMQNYQDEARKLKKGLWSDKNAIEPWKVNVSSEPSVL